MLDLRLLQQALTLAQTRSFARAAEALHLTQPALSRSIAGLEDTLGEKLFDRTPQGVVPTAYGKMLLGRAERLLADSREIERDFQMLRGLDIGELRVGLGPFPAAISAGRAVGELLTQHPGLAIDLAQYDIREMAEAVRRRELDLCVMELSLVDDMPELATEPLPRHPGYFVVRADHPLARMASPTLQDVSRYPLVINRVLARFAEVVGEVVARAGEGGSYLPQVRIASIELAFDIARHSNAIAVSALPQVADDVARGRLAVLPCRLPTMTSGYGFVYRQDRALSPAALAFMDAVRRVEAAVTAEEAALLAAWQKAKSAPPAPRRSATTRGKARPAPKAARA
jgi:DNA-binding transcriptional LysR family regulator